MNRLRIFFLQTHKNIRKITKNLFDQSSKDKDLIYFDLKIRLKSIEIRKIWNHYNSKNS